MYFLVATPFIFSDSTTKIAGVAAGSVIVNLTLNAALIPPFGTQGAAIATLLSYSALCVLMIRAAQRQRRSQAAQLAARRSENLAE
jgi:O-antigen/teichoic acid export membrane protein